MQNYPQSIFQSKIKDIHPRLEKSALLGIEPGDSRC